jgi:probable biosynthetic protein (TIGR04098 family)
MTNILHIVREVSREFDEAQLSVPFDASGLDSFDLLEIRVKLENATDHAIPDTEWIAFNSLQDIQLYLNTATSMSAGESEAGGIATQRRTSINMPQMALGGLSESWLLKEFGDIHWAMTCAALNSESHNLVDELGNRLYATFVRIRYESSHHLKQFQENELLDFQGRLSRFGKSMFFSDLMVRGQDKEITASLMTTFSVRQSNNKSLLKGEPRIPPGCAAEVLEATPRFASEYREMRKANMAELELRGQKFTAQKELLFETTYQLNPYLDLNGVNLLYFAAYPMISDYCEMEFMRQHHGDLSAGHWPLQASTIARDIFYYGNCDLDDRIVFGVNSFAPAPDGRFRIATSLFRESDRELIANIFTLKAFSE